MRFRMLAAPLLFALVFANNVSSAATITYSVDQTIGVGSVTGTVTTDGKIGTLSSSDFTSFSLELNGNGASSAISSSTGGIVLGSGADVTATLTAIYYNFDALDNGFLGFQQGGAYSGNEYWCNVAAGNFACAEGKSVVPVSYNDPSSIYMPFAGNALIAGSVSAVPEPSTWAMMILGFAGIGAMTYRRRKSATLVA